MKRNKVSLTIREVFPTDVIQFFLRINLFVRIESFIRTCSHYETGVDRHFSIVNLAFNATSRRNLSFDSFSNKR